MSSVKIKIWHIIMGKNLIFFPLAIRHFTPSKIITILLSKLYGEYNKNIKHYTCSQYLVNAGYKNYCISLHGKIREASQWIRHYINLITKNNIQFKRNNFIRIVVRIFHPLCSSRFFVSTEFALKTLRMNSNGKGRGFHLFRNILFYW